MRSSKRIEQEYSDLLPKYREAHARYHELLLRLPSLRADEVRRLDTMHTEVLDLDSKLTVLRKEWEQARD
jgi:hypothetical protein